MISFLNKLRFLFLKPDSRLELWLRTQYHHLMATRLAFKIQDWLAKRSYQKSRIKQNDQIMKNESPIKDDPKVSFILAWEEDHQPARLHTLASIKNLSGENWEVLIFADSQDIPSAIIQDPRIKIYNRTFELGLDHIQGSYILFCQVGDVFRRNLLQEFYQALDEEELADLFYYDCEIFDKISGVFLPHFKPSGFSPELMLSVNYLTRGIIRRATAEEISGGINPLKDLLAQEYDLNLKMVERKCCFHHIPQVLLTQAGLVTAHNSELREIIREHLTRLGLSKVGYVEQASGTRFTWHIGDPTLTVVILTKNNQAMLESLLASMKTDLRKHNAKINIVDNGSDDAATLAYYQKLSSEAMLSIIPYNQPFNYSEAINLGVKNSSSDLVLLLNDDMRGKDPDWLEELMAWALRSEVGVVGAKLIRANHSIQHAGIIMGLSGFAGHIYLNASEHYTGMFGSVDWYRDFLALTGACQMVRREVFDEVGGYDEGYQLAFGDLDFCLRVHERGYRNVYTPFASLYHYEGQTRGYSTPKADVIRGLAEMQSYLVEGDPYFSSNLTYTRIPKCAQNVTSQEERLSQIEARRKFYI